MGIDTTFPLPFRISAAIVLGVWGWGLNCHGLSAAHVDVAAMLQYPSTTSASSGPAPRLKLHTGVYELAARLTIVLVLSALIYNAQGSESPISTFVAYLCLCSIIADLFIIPTDSTGKRRFRSVFRRIARGSINKGNRLPDILVADALTSYARVLIDLALLIHNFRLQSPTKEAPLRAATALVAIANVFPFAIRLRQCYIDYNNTGLYIHLLNWGKYLTALPAILCAKALADLSIMAENDEAQTSQVGAALKIWAVTQMVNSLYSYFWDVQCDWALGALSPSSHHGGRLRPVLYFNSRMVYYGAILIDFMLRFIWALRLTHFGDKWLLAGEAGYFQLTLLEIIRRWIWVFFRVEAEWASSNALYKPRNSSVPMSDLSTTAAHEE